MLNMKGVCMIKSAILNQTSTMNNVTATISWQRLLQPKSTEISYRQQMRSEKTVNIKRKGYKCHYTLFK